MENIVKVAQELAKDMETNMNLSEEDKKNPDMSKVFTAATQQVMTLMQNGELMKKFGDNPMFEALMQPNQGYQPTLPSIPEEKKVTFREEEKKEPSHEIEEEDLNDDYVVDDAETIKPKTDNIEYTMEVKLEHLYTGKKKKIALRRANYKVVDGKIETFEEKKHLIVPIVPGTKHGDVITFNGQADHVSGHIPGDVIVTISEKEPEDESSFYRDENDLLLTRKIDLSDNYSLNMSITHLDGRVLILEHPVGQAIVSHTDETEEDRGNGIRKIIGEGMPIKNTNKKGDLYIRFDLVIPTKLTEEQTTKLSQVFEKEAVGEGEKVTLERLNDDELSDYSSDEDFSDDEDSFLGENIQEENIQEE